MSDRSDFIQEGIYFRPGEVPATHFAVLFLDINIASYPIHEILQTLDLIWSNVQDLKNGKLADLPNQNIDSKDLACFIGYGPSIFDNLKIEFRKPPELEKFKRPNSTGGGKISLSSGLSYRENISVNTADSSIVLQFTANSSLSVKRAIVETWKIVQSSGNSETVKPLIIRDSFFGFGREDKRSWIDFFDGTSNLRSDRRLEAIEIKKRSYMLPDSWKEKGTYMCYMRIQVALRHWIKLTRNDQEVLVGRDKITGCPLVDVVDGDPTSPQTCPIVGTYNVEDIGNENYRDAPRPARHKSLENSHIHRANQGRSNPSDPESRLIFRQGFEFMEGFDQKGQPQLGLNFVSFQDTPERILGMIKIPGWLGGVNFGGAEDSQLPGMTNLLEIIAAGFFILPPIDRDDLFPGRFLFDTESQLIT